MASIDTILEVAQRIVEDYEIEEERRGGEEFMVNTRLIERLRDELQRYELVKHAEERAARQ